VVYIPNTFTPNADSKNDIFEPTIYGVKSYTLKIYSRWGEKLHEGNSGWTGLDVPSGNYIYEIEFISNKNDRIFKNGVIQVLK
jgi:gliding motility-associated-like protein